MGIGHKIEQTFLLVLEFAFASAYLPPEPKIIILRRTNTKLDSLKFFVQLAWEGKLISTDKYSDLIFRLGEIGRQIGGWRKGLQTKTLRG